MSDYKKYFTKTNLLIVFAVIVLSVLAYLFLPIFYNKNIIILGNTSITSEDISLYTNQNMRKNTFLIDKKKIESDFKKNPYIQSITVKSKFPNTMVFNIIERKPIATIKFSGGFAIIDDNTIVLETTSDINKIKKPMITGINVKEIIVGEKIQNNNASIELGMKIISNIKSARLLNNISMVDISDLKNIYMITPQGINVLLGEGKDLNEKMLVLNKILVNLFERKITSGYVDMRYESYPVYRSKK